MVMMINKKRSATDTLMLALLLSFTTELAVARHN
jgi:hypothetical protein